MLTLDDLIPLLNYVKRYEGYVAALCPFHEDNNPSLLVFEKDPGAQHGWYQCLGCEARGTHEHLLSVLEGAPIRIAPREQTSWGLPRLPEDQDGWEELAYASHDMLMQRTHLAWYWEMRGVTDRIEPRMLGWYQGWYTVPVFDETGKFSRLILRAGEHIQKRTGARYYTSPGKPVINVPDWRRLKQAEAIAVVFGTIDNLALDSLGYPVCTSTSGKGQFKAEWLADIRPFVYIIPDKGEESTALTLANKIGGRARIVTLNYPDNCKDPADYLKNGKRVELQKELARYL
jgi:hypothetical protein